MRGKSAALVGLVSLIQIIALANHNGKPSQRSQWLFFIPIASICIYMVFFCASSDPLSDYLSITTFASFFFSSLDLILLRKYQRELQPSGQKPLSKMPFKDKLQWASRLSPRGIGWTHEPTRHLPPHPSSTPRKFILSQLMWMIFYFLQYDITNIFVRRNPCFVTGGPSLTAFGWSWRSAAWLYISLAHSSLSMSYIACSIVSVAIGMSEPTEWPHLFGSPLDGYTVRNCWGRVWHQILRKQLTGHADFITKLLRLPKSTFTNCFKLFIAFFVSGLIHYSTDYMLFQKSAGNSLQFFLLQVVAITWEDVMMRLAARAGFSSKPNLFTKLVGFIWVIGWFTYSLPLMVEGPIHGGLATWSFSLILGLRRGDWMPSR